MNDGLTQEGDGKTCRAGFGVSRFEPLPAVSRQLHRGTAKSPHRVASARFEGSGKAPEDHAQVSPPTADRLLDAAVEISQAPNAVDKAFMARQLVQCTLPHSDPGDTPIWTRVNGNTTLVIRPDFDRVTKKPLYPYGTVPRLLLLWMGD